jgi:hypothetical protein
VALPSDCLFFCNVWCFDILIRVVIVLAVWWQYLPLPLLFRILMVISHHIPFREQRSSARSRGIIRDKAILLEINGDPGKAGAFSENPDALVRVDFPSGAFV